MPPSTFAKIIFVIFIFGRAGDAACGAGADLDARHRGCLYVSTTGNDDWSGMLPAPSAAGSDGPFATLDRARDALRKLRSQGEFTGRVTIVVLEGTYYLSEPVIFDSQDVQQPVTITAYPGHKPLLSGGRPVSAWEPYQGKILQCRLPDGRSNFRQLFLNGKRQIRARWPNRDPQNPIYGGWAFVDATPSDGQQNPNQFRFAADSMPRNWEKPELAEVNIFPWYCWVNDLIPVQQADPKQQTITLGRGVHFDFMSLVEGNRFCVENVLEDLDQPGEWCFDHQAATIYFWPPTGSLEKGQVVVPVTDSLIELRGTPQKPLRQVTISGLSFAHTLSPFPDYMHESHHAPPLRGAAVLLEHCEDCRIEDNRFRLLGGEAVRLNGPNRRNRIEGNEIADIGGAGITLTSQMPENVEDTNDKAALSEHASRYPRLVRNVVANNHIHHCGVIKKNCGGVQLYGINSVDNRIAHNLIHDMSDKGMVMQDGFGRFIVEYNEMRTLGLEIADTGGIMTNRWFVIADEPDLARGNIIRYNLIRDCIGCGAYAELPSPKGEGDRTQAGGKIHAPFYTWGIYFDNSGTNILVFGNIVISTVLGGVSMPVGSPLNNRVENNIFVGSSGNQLDLRTGDGARGNRFLRNIVYFDDPDAMLLAARASAKQTIAECDYNVYYAAGGQELRVRGLGPEAATLADWQKLGFDQHSIVADPLFVDAAKNDFRLQPDSPAYRLGFRPIPIDRIGLQRKVATAGGE